MKTTIRNTNSDNLVNYETSSTAISNIDVPNTSSEESIAFLIKNNIFIEYHLSTEPLSSKTDKNRSDTETSIYLY
jgi:hypothetical protein